MLRVETLGRKNIMDALTTKMYQSAVGSIKQMAKLAGDLSNQFWHEPAPPDTTRDDWARLYAGFVVELFCGIESMAAYHLRLLEPRLESTVRLRKRWKELGAAYLTEAAQRAARHGGHFAGARLVVPESQ